MQMETFHIKKKKLGAKKIGEIHIQNPIFSSIFPTFIFKKKKII
jgi:hypothetical protein